ncbi:uncharacterized protein MELLADRAFT_93813 [Melampsora larici-populina 98AG31]|uniref:Uncharacterized protein n=1 Tax=Melampsora larici-populina (strain 98AG31 / pathotype 3-4-7) TaxID=747676 RepID=F4S5C5_MELLP|nr:uncharacterized protein MELLADRAFT_93813 [Melampsora larici-populina 98AG31]EGG00142.1 hypothetical protein MELLADRAFT_93813 [Melampsora larici-populina 98AG31]
MAQGAHHPPKYFEMISTVASNPKWKCLVCGQHMGNIGPHSISQSHLAAVERYEACLAAENAIVPSLSDEPPPSPVTTPHQQDILGDDEPAPDTTRRPPSPFSFLRAFQLAKENQPSDSESSETEIDVHKVLEAIHAMDDDAWGPNNEADDEANLVADLRTGQLLDSEEWFPFKKKESTARCCVIDHRFDSKYPFTGAIPSYSCHIDHMRRPPARMGGATCVKCSPQEGPRACCL